MASHDPARVMYHSWRSHDDARPWPTIPAKPKVVAEPKYEVMIKEAYQDSAVTPMEWLGQLSVRSTTVGQSAGRSTKPGLMTTMDVAAALGCVTDPLKQQLAFALATMTVCEWRTVQTLAWPLLIEQLLASHKTRAMVAGRKKLRARLLLHDAFFDLALRRPPRFVLEGAHQLDMPVRDYKALYRSIAGFLETYAQEGAGEARAKFGRGE